MRTLSIQAALNEALRQEMRQDSRVILLGEDIAGGAGSDVDNDAMGGSFGVTRGLLTEFGADRVMDTPISESAFIGAAAGAALTGMRPVVELMFVDFMGVCFDQIFNQAAKFRYMFGGKSTLPLVIRTTIGAGLRSAAQHSQTLYPLFTAIAGLKCVAPSNAYDAKGLLISAMRDNNPVVFFEHKAIYDQTAEVPEHDYSVPLGKARLIRPGDDAVIITLSAMVRIAETAADQLQQQGIHCAVLDLRSLSPLDEQAILDQVRHCGRVVLVDEAPPRCGIAADVASLIVERAFEHLKAPVIKVTPPHTPVPFAPNLEDAYIPRPEQVIAAVQQII